MAKKHSKAAADDSSMPAASFKHEVILWAVLALSIILFISNFGIAGSAGNFISSIFFGLFGLAAYIFPILLFAGTAFMIANKDNALALIKASASFAFFIFLCMFLELIGGNGSAESPIDSYIWAVEHKFGGGLAGGLLTWLIRPNLGTISAYVIDLIMMIICIVLITQRSIWKHIQSGSKKVYVSAKNETIRQHQQYAERRKRRIDNKVSGVSTDTSIKSGAKSGISDNINEIRPDPAFMQQDFPIHMMGEHRAKQSEPSRGWAAAQSVQPSELFRSEFRSENDGLFGQPAAGEVSGSQADGSADITPFPAPDQNQSVPAQILEAESEFLDNIIPVKNQKVALQPNMPHIEAENHEASVNDTAGPADRQQAAAPDIDNLSDILTNTSDLFSELLPSASEQSTESAAAGSAEAGSLSALELLSSNSAAAPGSMDSADLKDLSDQKFSDLNLPDQNLSDLKDLSDQENLSALNALSYQKNLSDINALSDQKAPSSLADPADFSDQSSSLVRTDFMDGSGLDAVPASVEAEPLLNGDLETSLLNGVMEEPSENALKMHAGNTDLHHKQQSTKAADIESIFTSAQELIAQELQNAAAPPARNTAASAAGKASMQAGQKSGAAGAAAPIGLRNPKQSQAEIASDVTQIGVELHQAKPPVKRPHVLPPVDLLKYGDPNKTGDSRQHLQETALKLQQTLKNFGVNVTILNVSCGPSVTRYEIQPEMGVKVSKIVNLADDIKLNLAAADIRIEAPIPGKAAIGIEVPNKENVPVMFRDLIEAEEFKQQKSPCAFAAGKDIAGQVVVTDICKMPHLLIAGATGSGKSVCINTIIMSIIYKADPDDVKMIMIDPKVVELSVYNGIPHLLLPVVTDPKKAAGALHWAVSEMMDRYQKFADCGVRDVKGYNEKIKKTADIADENKPQKMPYIVIIVDELADLMMAAPGDVEDAICRLAQLARAAGIHLIIATQRPSVNVITGLIKANMPSRIAFSVTSGIDSRTILDMNGAEKLLGKGDMLFYPQGYQKPVRVQGAFVSDSEVSEVVEFLIAQNGASSYSSDIEQKVTSASSGGGSSADSAPEDDKDVYFADAAKLLIDKEKASVSMLQRYFKIGFNRAARIMDQLEEAGVVGPEEGTKPRKILMGPEEFEQYVEEVL